MKNTLPSISAGLRAPRLLLVAFAALALAAGATAALQLLGKTAQRALPTARVQRGNLDLTVYTRGELRPVRTNLLVAPSVRGQLQITFLVKNGERVRKDDVVIEFDPSEQEYNIEQARSELLQAEQEITKAKADATVQASQDEVALLGARFAVRRAELDVSRNELVSAIDARKNDLALEEAKRKLTQLQEDMKARQVTSKASVAVLEQKRNRQRIQLERAETDLRNLKLLAPFDGLVTLRGNEEASGGMFYQGMILPEYRQGDQVWPGRGVAEILDVSQMEVSAKVSEVDRARIQPGQPVTVEVHARPTQKFSGKVKAVGGQASGGGFWESTGGDRKFDISFVLDVAQIPLRPGVSCTVQIIGQQVKDALLVPRQAVFERDGKPVVYFRKGKGYEAQIVKVLNRSESRVAIEGLTEGTEVALADPNKSDAKKPAKANGPVMTGGPK